MDQLAINYALFDHDHELQFCYPGKFFYYLHFYKATNVKLSKKLKCRLSEWKDLKASKWTMFASKEIRKRPTLEKVITKHFFGKIKFLPKYNPLWYNSSLKKSKNHQQKGSKLDATFWSPRLPQLPRFDFFNRLLNIEKKGKKVGLLLIFFRVYTAALRGFE